MPRRLDPDDIKRLRRLRRRGLSIEDIAAATGVAKSAVQRRTADLGKDRRAAANRARARRERETPPNWLPAARALLAEGVTRYAAAARLGVGKSYFYRIIDRFGA